MHGAQARPLIIIATERSAPAPVNRQLFRPLNGCIAAGRRACRAWDTPESLHPNLRSELRMSSRIRLLALIALACFAPAVFAQGYYSLPDSRPVRFYVMGGFNQPAGSANSVLQGGWDVGFGVAFRQPGSPLALRLEVNYSNNNATNALINQGQQQTGLQITGGYADLYWGTANAEYQ